MKQDNWTPLLFASYHGHTDIVAFLLTQPGIKINQQAISRRKS